MTETTLNDCPCGAEPQFRHDENRGLFLYACPVCKYYSEPSPVDSQARARWNQATGDFLPCLGCGNRPRLRRSKVREMWVYVCTGCVWKGNPVHTVEAAFTSWHRSNLTNDEHVWGLWRVRHHELQEQLEKGSEVGSCES